MSLQAVYSKVKKLSGTSSSLAKVELLKEYLHDPLFQKVSVFTLDSRRTYNVKKFPKFDTITSSGGTASELLDLLDQYNEQEGVTNEDKQALFAAAAIDEATYELTRLICNGSFKCGCSVKTFNKALLGSIFYIPYCRCSTDSKIDKIMWPAYAQEKADGTFTNMMVSAKGKITFLTRDGNKLKQLKKLKKTILKKLPKEYYGHVFQGELLIQDGSGVLNRQTGNGIITSCQYGSADQSLADNVILRLWDIIPIDAFWSGAHHVPYIDRYEIVLRASATVGHKCFTVVNTVIVNNLKEAQQFYKKMRAEGNEGCIIKAFLALWKDHTSPMQIKMKNVIDVEALIAGIYYGEENGKYEKCLGGIECVSGCGKISVSVGGGFSDEQRGYFPVEEDHPNAVQEKDNDIGFTDDKTKEYFPPKYIDGEKAKAAIKWWTDEIGSVAGLECESVSLSKSKKVHSLYLPRFDMIRTDKKPDTLAGLEERGACANLKIVA